MKIIALTAHIARLIDFIGVLFIGILLLAGALSGYAATDTERAVTGCWEGYGFPPNYPPEVNPGVTSAGVRMWFVAERQVSVWYFPYRIISLVHFEGYHESSLSPAGGDWNRIIFTAETPVRDFKFLQIMPNENWPGEGQRRYAVHSTLYVLPLLTAEIPFVTVWENMFWEDEPAYGFSFIDEDGVTRYFALVACSQWVKVYIREF